MDAATALTELTGPSSQVESAVVLDADGNVLGSTGRGVDQLAAATGEALAAANGLRSSDDEVTCVQVVLADGCLLVVREGGRTIAATAGPGAEDGDIVFDLLTCLGRIDAKPKRRAKSKKEDA